MAENNKKSNDKKTAEETQNQKRCFVMMPISDNPEYEENHFTKVYTQIISPAIKQSGYEPYRVDENSISDSIINKILDGITKYDMAICDLSSRNPNVLYELGLRHAFDMPVVLICDEITKPIFDVSGITIIKYRSSRLYDEVIEDQKNIKQAIKENETSNSGYSLIKLFNINKAIIESEEKTDSETTTFMLNKIINMVGNISTSSKPNSDSLSNSISKLNSDILKYSTSYIDGSLCIPENLKIHYSNKLSELFFMHRKNEVMLKETDKLLSTLKTTPTKYFTVVDDDNDKNGKKL